MCLSKLASVLFKESQGNPRYIEYLIKHLYASGRIVHESYWQMVSRS